MSLIDKIKAGFLGPLPLPAIDALGAHRTPVALVGESQSFTGWDDPALSEYFKIGANTAAGVVINEKLALRNSAMFRAATLICGSFGLLPCHLWRKTDVTHIQTDKETGEKKTVTSPGSEKATDHPGYRLLMKRPNSFQTPFEFKSFLVSRALFEGVGYAVKRRKVSAKARGGMITSELIPLRTALVEPKMTKDFRLFFRYHDPDGPPIDINSDDMFWFRSPLSSDGVTGAKLLDVAREALGLSYQSEQATGRVLRNGAIVGGVLEHPKALSDDAIHRLRTQFEERQSTVENAGKWIVAEDGLQAKPFGTTLKDAQNSELRKFQIEEISRFTGVPRPLLSLDETNWGSGIEQLGLFLITYALMPLFISFEEAASRSLLSEEEQDDYYFKFNEGALLRGSLKDQSEFFARALGSGGGRGWMSQNEVRDKMELNPKDDGDELPEPITKGQTSGGNDQGTGEADDEADANKPKPPKQ